MGYIFEPGKLLTGEQLRKKNGCGECKILAGSPECWEKNCGKTIGEKQYAAYLANNYQDPRD